MLDQSSGRHQNGVIGLVSGAPTHADATAIPIELGCKPVAAAVLPRDASRQSWAEGEGRLMPSGDRRVSSKKSYTFEGRMLGVLARLPIGFWLARAEV